MGFVNIDGSYDVSPLYTLVVMSLYPLKFCLVGLNIQRIEYMMYVLRYEYLR